MKKLLWAIFLTCAGMLAFVELASADVIGVTFNGTVASFDSTIGTTTVLGNAGITRLDSLATSPSGILYSVGGTSDNTLVTINPTTGQATTVATLNYNVPKPTGTATGLSFSPTGELFAVIGASSTWSLYNINPTTGATTFVGSTGIQVGFQDLAFSPNGTLYAWNGTNGLVTINPTTGQTTILGNPNGLSFNSLAFRNDGTLWAAKSTSPTLWSNIDLSTGAVTSTAFTFAASGGIRGIQFLAPVPVPAAIWLFGSGLAGVVGYVRRKRRERVSIL